MYNRNKLHRMRLGSKLIIQLLATLAITDVFIFSVVKGLFLLVLGGGACLYVVIHNIVVHSVYKL